MPASDYNAYISKVEYREIDQLGKVKAIYNITTQNPVNQVAGATSQNHAQTRKCSLICDLLGEGQICNNEQQHTSYNHQRPAVPTEQIECCTVVLYIADPKYTGNNIEIGQCSDIVRPELKS